MRLKRFQKLHPFGTSSCIDSASREARMMMKMLSSKQERKLWNGKSHSIQRAAKLLDGKRAVVLNKLFMLNVTQAMMSGDFDDLLDNKGVQVTRVAIDSNYSVVFVFWICKESADPVEVESILDSLSGKVRQKLLYSNVMGRIPEIRFQRDIKEEQIQAVSNILTLLGSSNVLNDFKESTSPPDRVDNYDSNMIQHTLGLKHDQIMQRIQRSKSNAYPLTMPVPPTSSEDMLQNVGDPEEIESESSSEQYERQKALRKFMAQFKKSQIRLSVHNIRYSDAGRPNLGDNTLFVDENADYFDDSNEFESDGKHDSKY